MAPYRPHDPFDIAALARASALSGLDVGQDATQRARARG